jgi:glycine/D-amino acid oxidase-like deaminating enzyme
MERYETVIIGGGQAGLSVGYHLQKRNRSFVILDASERIGDSWRQRGLAEALFPAFRDPACVSLPSGSRIRRRTSSRTTSGHTRKLSCPCAAASVDADGRRKYGVHTARASGRTTSWSRPASLRSRTA